MQKQIKQIEIQVFQEKFKAEMPKIFKEIEIYEMALKEGKLNKKPLPAPQFNLG